MTRIECPACGKLIPPTAAACPECGHILEQKRFDLQRLMNAIHSTEPDASEEDLEDPAVLEAMMQEFWRAEDYIERLVLGEYLAGKTGVPQDFLRDLARFNSEILRNQTIRERIAGNPSTPEYLLRELARDIDPKVRGHVAENPSTPEDARLMLSHEIAARDPSTPESLLLEFSEDKAWFVRAAAAGNPSTPLNALIRFADDRDADVRRSVAANPSSPQDVLRKLAGDRDKSVRRCVAMNPSISEDILEGLLSTEGHRVFLNLARNPKTPEALLMKLVRMVNDFELNCIIAQNPSLSQDALLELISEGHAFMYLYGPAIWSDDV